MQRSTAEFSSDDDDDVTEWKPSLEVAPTNCGWCYLFTLSNSSPLLLLVVASGFSGFALSLLAENEGTFASGVNLNFDLWPWPTNLTYIWSSWTIVTDI